MKVAHIIKKVFKDDLVFRYGGEEFSVISTQEEIEIIQKIKILIEEINEMGITHIESKVSDRITLSIGVGSKYIAEKSDLAQVVKMADENLYKSKNNGRNQYTYGE